MLNETSSIGDGNKKAVLQQGRLGRGTTSIGDDARRPLGLPG
jgi:hypothetical protein